MLRHNVLDGFRRRRKDKKKKQKSRKEDMHRVMVLEKKKKQEEKKEFSRFHSASYKVEFSTELRKVLFIHSFPSNLRDLVHLYWALPHFDPENGERIYLGKEEEIM